MGAEAIVQHLIDIGVSHPQQMAIGGHSYGALQQLIFLLTLTYFRPVLLVVEPT